MGVRAERKARRKNKVVKYAQSIADEVRDALDRDDVKVKLALAALRSDDHWNQEFGEVVCRATHREVKSCPQEKELIIDGMGHYLEVLFAECDKDRERQRSEAEGKRLREEEAAKKKAESKKKKEAAAA